MGKHAYLIIAHNEPDIFDKLLDLINDSRNDVFVHIDARSEINLFEKIAFKYKKSSIFFCTERIKTYWGDYSQVETELRLLDMAETKMKTEKNEYERIHLISGVDLPLKSQDEIHAFFARYPKKEFVQFWGLPKEISKKYLNRYKFYTFMHFDTRTHGAKIFLHGYMTISNAVQQILKIDRRKKEKKLALGSNWISITPRFLKYILSNKQWIKKTYKNTVCADESFVQTLLINSAFVTKLYASEMDGSYLGNMRNIDWVRGRPYVWRTGDLNELLCSEYMFARKFSSTVDKEIITELFDAIKAKKGG